MKSITTVRKTQTNQVNETKQQRHTPVERKQHTQVVSATTNT